MKIIKKIIIALILLVIGAMAGLSVYLFDEGDAALITYVEETLIPNAVLALTSVFGLAIASYPILEKITKRLADFSRATDKLERTSKNGEDLLKENEAFKEAVTEELKSLKDALTDKLSEYTKELTSAHNDFSTLKEELIKEEKAIEAGEDQIKKMLLIGLCNNSELVKKGYAREIAKVVKKDEKG